MAAELGVVQELWRYPVMGLRGERVQEAEIVWGETLTAPGLLDLSAEFTSSPSISSAPSVGITLPDGNRISSDDPEFEAMLGEALHQKLKLLDYPQVAEARIKSGRALHILTSSSLEAIRGLYPTGDFDVRRFRPNIVIDTPVEGFPEEDWVESIISVGGEVRLKVEKPNKRCKLITMKQGEMLVDEKIYETISTKHDNTLGAMCSVLGEGRVRVGDQVMLLS
ncbi:MAG: MOSC domain-containing protein [Thaumarchaeota archaeon]|nr:MOSC domain-containing protein [Nitrososphaerota archaeon]